MRQLRTQRALRKSGLNFALNFRVRKLWGVGASYRERRSFATFDFLLGALAELILSHGITIAKLFPTTPCNVFSFLSYHCPKIDWVSIVAIQ